MAADLTDAELRELYEVLNRCQQHLKHEEQAQAALKFDDKPPKYSPLVIRLMAVRERIGEHVSRLQAAGR